jgi:hypothetical protein
MFGRSRRVIWTKGGSSGIQLMVAGLVAIVGLLPPAHAFAADPTTRWVDSDGHAGPIHGCDGSRVAFRQIQRAVTASGTADTVLVCPGVYEEDVEIHSGRTGLTLRSVDPHQAVIAPRTVDNGYGAILVVDSDVPGVRVKGFRLSARTGGQCQQIGYAVLALGRAAVLRDNAISVTGGDPYGPCGLSAGIQIGTRAMAIANSVVGFKGGGIVSSGGGSIVARNTLRQLPAGRSLPDQCVGGGIYAFGDDMHVRANRIVGLATANYSLCDGIYQAYPIRDVVIRDNVVRYAFSAIAVGNGATNALVADNVVLDSKGRFALLLYDLIDSTIRGNRVTGSASPGLWVRDDSHGLIIHDNDLRGNAGLDCLDESAGNGTMGTANTWRRNLGDDSRPKGICRASP